MNNNNFLIFLSQDKSDVIHSVTENITNIDATTKQNRAMILAVNKNILSIFITLNISLKVN